MIATGGMLDADAPAGADPHRCKALTDKPFGVNLMLMNPCADEMAQVVVEEGVQVVTTGAGSPGKYIPAWKEAGIKVLPRGGRRHPGQAAGAATAWTRFIAEGTRVRRPCGRDDHHGPGAPGDRRGETCPSSPPAASPTAVRLAAAFALGACGVQVGTCLLASRECPIHDNYKQALLKAKDSDTTVTGRSIGAPVRVLKNKMAREYLALEQAGARLWMELEHVYPGLPPPGGVRRGHRDAAALMAGQVAGHAPRDPPPAADF